MKRIIGILLALLLPIFVMTAVASAQTFRSGGAPIVATNETVDGSAFLAGATVDVAGKVDGDLYCAGQTITISGEVTGDVICAGQTINFTGTVAGDIRLAGQTVTTGGQITKSATVIGQTITVERQGTIGQDVVLTGQTITVNGTVKRDAVITGGTATLSGKIGRDVTATIDKLTLGGQAVIDGSLDYTSPRLLAMNSGASVGSINYTHAKTKIEARAAVQLSWLGAFISTLMLVVSALLFVLIFPRALHDTTKESIQTPAQALLAVLVGFIAGIVMPVAFIFLMVTILGIPLAFILLLSWLLILALSGAFSAYYVGRLVWQNQPNAVLSMFIGALILAVLLLIPILNIIVWLFAAWYGSGVILLQLKKTWITPRYAVKTGK